VKERKIKTDWASLTVTGEGQAVVCVECSGTARCLQFDSLEELKKALYSKKIAVKKWAVAVPRSLCILKPLTVPASDMAEVAKMLEFELPSLVPLPPNEIVYGCTRLNKQDNMLKVLVCILKVNVLNEYLGPYEAIGIEPRRITLDSLAVQNWFSVAGGVTSDAKISVFVEKHRCIVLTCINGDFHMTDEGYLPEGHVGISSREVVQEIFSRQDQLPAWLREKTAILLAGAKEYTSEIESLLRAAPGKAGYEKVRIVESPQIACCQGGNDDRDGNGLSFEAVATTGLFELAVNSKLPYSNLLPREYLKRTRLKALLYNYLLTGLLSLLLILLLWLSLVTMNWRIEKRSRMIERQIAPIEYIASTVESKRQRIKAVRNQISNRGQVAKILEELYRYTPRTISISELRFVSRHNGASIEIKGQADVLSNAFEYVNAVSQAELLGTIQIVNAQQIPRPGGSVVEFKAECVVRND